MPIESTNSFSGAIPAPGAVPGPASSGGPHLNLWGSDGFTFSDLLDFINPLQHIPVVSTLYRSFTGDEIGNAARIVGGAALGGIGGAVSSLIDAAVQLATGKDIGGHVLSFIKDIDIDPAAGSQLAQQFGLDDVDGIENVDYENAPETILVSEDDTTYDQDIAAARAAAMAPNVAALKQSKAPAKTAMATPASAQIPAQIPVQIPPQIDARVARPGGQAGSAPSAAPSPMAIPNMAASSIAKAAFAGGSSLPAGSAFYAAQPANAVAALMATAKPVAQNPAAQNTIGAAAPTALGVKNMVDQTGGQPFWLGLMAENADKAQSQNLIPTTTPKAANAATASQLGQQGKTLAQYRAAARLGVMTAPGKQIYR